MTEQTPDRADPSLRGWRSAGGIVPDAAPDPLADLIAAHKYDPVGRVCICGVMCGIKCDNLTHAAHVAAVIRAAQDEDNAREVKAARRAEDRLRDERDTLSAHIDALEGENARIRADLAAHHDTRPGREQIAAVRERIDTVASMVATTPGLTREAYDALQWASRVIRGLDDDVLALLGPTPVPDVTFDHPITIAGVPAEDRRTGPRRGQDGPGSPEHPTRRHTDGPDGSGPATRPTWERRNQQGEM